MNIYLFTIGDEHRGYDCFDAHLVIEKTPKLAREFIISHKARGDEGMMAWKEAKCKKIGTTDLKPQIVISSFNAG